MGIARKLVNDRAHRLELGIPATVRRFADPIDAIVINISATGFKAKVDRSLNIGDHVELGVGGKRLGGRQRCSCRTGASWLHL